VTIEASTRGEDNCIFHPWSTWDVLGEHVEVVAHDVGGVCYSSRVPLGDMEECVAFPKVLM
jgi:hypothetical protein